MYIRFEVEGTGLYMAGPYVLWRCDETWRAGRPRPRGVRPACRRTVAEYGELMDLFVTGLRKPGGDAYESLKGTRTRTYFRVGDLTRANVEAGWQMVALLRRHGHRAYEVYSAIPPGIITFIDDRQIVVREASRRG